MDGTAYYVSVVSMMLACTFDVTLASYTYTNYTYTRDRGRAVTRYKFY